MRNYVIGLLGFVGLVMLSSALAGGSGLRYWYKEKGLVPMGTPAVGETKPEVYSPILYLTDEKNEFFCSGFAIDDHYAITAAHCVVDKVGKVINVDEGLTKARVVGINARVDYALLAGDFRQFVKLPVNTTRPLSQRFIGKPLQTCGFPGGQHTPVCTVFLVVGQRMFFLAGHGELYPGMSGGPVVDPESGIAVGINSAVDGESEKTEDYDISYVSRLTGLAGSFGIEPRSNQ